MMTDEIYLVIVIYVKSHKLLHLNKKVNLFSNVHEQYYWINIQL